MTTADQQRQLDAVATRSWSLTIGGRSVPAQGGRTYTTTDPARQIDLAEVPDATDADVDAAVEAAEEGFAVWRRIPARGRAATLRDLACILRENSDELALLDSADGGSPITAMRRDVGGAAALLDVAADWVLDLSGRTVPVSPGNLHFTTHEPYGVVARIIPFNHPLLFAAGKLAAPLLAGNSVIVKAPHQTPLSALRMGELFAEALPPGTVNVLTGSGPEAGDALVRHPAVRRVAFIGSETTGRAIQRAAAEVAVKHVSLELGGKNAMLVFPDADLDVAATGAVVGMNFTANQGQSCGSNSRLLVHESIAADLVDAVVARVEQIRVGMPLDPETEMGALVSQEHYDRVLSYVRDGREEGAVVATGGGRPVGFDRGCFLAPTVFSAVDPSMRIAQEEIFGPVLSVLTFADEADAVQIANGVRYGLTASVWTSDLGRAHRVAQALEAGFVWVNGSGRHFPGVPFGGVKASGLGREESPDEVLSFTEVKAVNMMLDGGSTRR